MPLACPEPYGGPWERPVREVSLNRNMIHSERVGAERKRNHRRREGESRSNRSGRKKENTATNGRKEGKASVLIWPFSCPIVVFVLTTHKKKRRALSQYVLSRSPPPYSYCT